MKTKESLSKSADAARKDAVKQAQYIADSMNHIRADSYAADAIMPMVREALAELNQRVHEFNAYHNALTTD